MGGRKEIPEILEKDPQEKNLFFIPLLKWICYGIGVHSRKERLLSQVHDLFIDSFLKGSPFKGCYHLALFKVQLIAEFVNFQKSVLLMALKRLFAHAILWQEDLFLNIIIERIFCLWEMRLLLKVGGKGY